ncbi:MAG: GntR family transcriptional regulator [Candidatus Rokubacteria bacterium]|nr:GntR family transcriptional regulator [Candidatus Rokubacteria bacterium]
MICKDILTAMTIRYRPGIPRYLQIAEVLRARIRAGAWTAGGRIPSEHALCAEFRVSRPTVRQALDLLVQEGVVSREQGRGTFASPMGALPQKFRVIGSVEDMLALGEETWFKALTRDVIPAPAEVARALHLGPGDLVVRVTGVRHTDATPFQHVTAYLPEPVGRAILDEDLTKTSVIGTVEQKLGLAVKYLEQVVDVALAPREVAELLGLPRRSALLHFRRTYFTTGGQPVEHALTYQSGPRYPYKVVLLRAERKG